ncbi:ABC transporter-like protein [Candidatus Puniceispirillum marinum]|uniref:ABC transporter related protein n=1 Tax=Puniceispirillum marinum (strain IMCC1322) TaxID=488538 RepID=D5BQP5_PUNMI|nr:ABC transporter-like protein [Candidatus Puniceispirillum marinum]ADE40763.1 ABC transporter related protein [Candidatus Puniceispirillum marinum IMCC1322]
MIDFKKLLGRSETPVNTELSAEAYALLQQLQQSANAVPMANPPHPLNNPFAPENASSELAGGAMSNPVAAKPNLANQAPASMLAGTVSALDLPQATIAQPNPSLSPHHIDQTGTGSSFQMPQARAGASSGLPSSDAADAALATMPPNLGLGAELATMPPVVSAKVSKAKERAQQKAKASNANREDKKQAAQRAREEKLRNQRRKALAKTRFSRARYLRELNGNAIAGTILWGFMIVVSLIGPFLLNTSFLLPQTRINRDVIGQIRQFEAVISQAQPQIAAANQRKAEKEAQINDMIRKFVDSQTANEVIRNFIEDLKAAGMSVNDGNLQFTQEDIAVSGLIGQTLSVEMKGDFLTYLRLRNRFVRDQELVHVRDESIMAKPNNRIVAINLRLMVPSSI